MTMAVLCVAATLEVVSGMFLLATESAPEKYPTIHRVSKGVFTAIGIIALVAVLVMEW